MLTSFLETLPDALPNISGDASTKIAAMCLELTISTIASAVGKERAWSLDAAEVFLAKAKSYVTRNIADETLTPEKIARAAGIGRRQLSTLFAAEDDSISGFLWRTRLEKCKVALESPGFAHLNIAQIAFAHGFKDTSHFSRAFRNRFGVPARHCRANQPPNEGV